MSIVLPRRQKVNIFSPSKAIQRAKEKLGPGYFDATLLECSRNAVELSKLVNKWEDIDKKKLKYVRELCIEQARLIRAIKSHKERMDDDPIASIEGVETPEGKMIPPGFRFKSNGDLKTSSTAMATVHMQDDNDENDENDIVGSYYMKQHGKLGQTESKDMKQHTIKHGGNMQEVDYDKEIRELEGVLFDIYKTLLKNRVELFKSTGGNIKTYLRAHKNDYVPTDEPIDYDYENPNDRFAFKPGSSKSEYLSRKKISNPTHRACIGCQFRLKATSDPVNTIVRGKDEVGKRRWSYVPQGKYVDSMSALSTVSLAKKQSKSGSGSNARLVEYDQKVRGTRSEKIIKILGPKDSGVEYDLRLTPTSPDFSPRYCRSKSAPSVKELRFDTSCASVDSGLAEGQSGTTLSGKSSRNNSEMWRCGSGSFYPINSSQSISCRADSSSHFRHLLVDQKSRLKALKTMQAQEEMSCRDKVKDFLTKLDSTSSMT